MKKVLSLVLVAVMMMAMLAGCGGGNKETQAPGGSSAAPSQGETQSAAPSGETKTLEFMWFADSETETNTMRSILDAYEAENPGIKVEMVEVPYADLNQKIMMALSGGEAPALARVTGADNFIDNALRLNEAFGGSEAFLSAYGDGMRSFTQVYRADQDLVYAIPMEASVCCVIYNKTAFEKAGVKAPESSDKCWTWDEFNAAMQACIDSGATRYGLDLDNTTQRWTNVFLEFGGRFLDDSTGKPVPAFTSDAARNALEFTKECMDSGVWCKNVYLGGEDATNLFVSGQAAAHIGGSWKVGAYHEQITDFEWGITYLPYKEVRANCTGYKQLMGFQGSGVEEEAAKLLVYLASPAAAPWFENCMFISPRKDAAEYLNYEFGQDMFTAMSEDAAATNDAYFQYSYKYPGYAAGMGNVIIETVCEYLNGDISVEEAMKAIDDKSAEALAAIGY